MSFRQTSDAQTSSKDNQRFSSVNYKREKTIMDWNRKVHSSPIKVYRRFSEHESKPKSEVRSLRRSEVRKFVEWESLSLNNPSVPSIIWFWWSINNELGIVCSERESMCELIDIWWLGRCVGKKPKNPNKDSFEYSFRPPHRFHSDYGHELTLYYILYYIKAHTRRR